MIDMAALRAEVERAILGRTSSQGAGPAISVVLRFVSEHLFQEAHKMTRPTNAAVANLAALLAEQAKVGVP